MPLFRIFRNFWLESSSRKRFIQSNEIFAELPQNQKHIKCIYHAALLTILCCELWLMRVDDIKNQCATGHPCLSDHHSSLLVSFVPVSRKFTIICSASTSEFLIWNGFFNALPLPQRIFHYISLSMKPYDRWFQKREGPFMA